MPSRRSTKKRPRRLRVFLVGPVLRNGRELRQMLEAAGYDAEADGLIAIDGGLDHCLAARLAPELAVGDWDSITSVGKAALVPHITLPQDKDRSDLHFALAAACEAGATEVHCFGVTGGDPHHQLGGIYELAHAARGLGGRKLIGVWAHDPSFSYCFISKAQRAIRMHLPVHQSVSVFPVGGAARGVTLRGFKFPLKDAVLESTSHGLDNVVTAQPVEISVKEKGVLVVMVPANPVTPTRRAHGARLGRSS